MTDYYLSSKDIAECITNLVARNKLWANKVVSLFYIVNVKAGCFTNKRISKHYYSLFYNTNIEALKSDECAISTSYEIYSTQYQNHATEITKDIVKKIISEFDKSKEYIVVTCGGDGTSLEVQTALYNSYLQLKDNKPEIMKNISIIRLPLGTGNDGTDGNYIKETFEILKSGLVYSNSKVIVAHTKNNPPSDVIRKSNLLVSKYCDINSKSPWLSFNIASIGIDSFVCFVTNLVKSKFPGNLYHLFIPLCGLFYNRIFQTGKTTISMYNNIDDKEPANVFSGEIFLTVVGTSGHRTYGGGHKVLPNNHNICIAAKIPLWRIIRDNPKFANGKHVGLDIGQMYSADKIIIENDEPIMLQCDGECYLLCKEHFPLTLEKLDAGFKIIKRI